MISWKTTNEEFDLIAEIADRIVQIANRTGVKVSKQEFIMDITAAHANGCRLDLAELLAAPDFDFAHDVFGIHRHINRDNGKLMDCFVPRMASHGKTA